VEDVGSVFSHIGKDHPTGTAMNVDRIYCKEQYSQNGGKEK
jgi:hypothetical protein